MLDLAQTIYEVRAIDRPETIGVNITDIVAAEARLAEVATVTQQTAPELLTNFNRNWLELHRITSILTYQKNRAENAYNKASNEALLECNDDAIKAKGHSKASADLRKALSELDKRVIDAKDKLDELTALVSFLKGKQDAFQKGYESVKKLVGAGQLPNVYIGNGNRPEPFSQKPQSGYINTKTDYDSDLDLPPGFRA